MTKMSVNKKKIYETVSTANLNENWFDWTHTFSFTCKFGELVPCFSRMVVPGQVLDIENIMLNRFPPLIAPAFLAASATVHYFYVPLRVLWESFDEWFEEVQTADGSNYTVPFMEVVNTLTAEQKRFLDFLRINPMSAGRTNQLDITAYRQSAYVKIYNDYYRARPFLDPQPFELPAAGGDIGGSLTADLCQIRQRAWEHDYHTSMLPEPMVAPTVNIPLTIQLDPDYILNGAVPKFMDGSATPIPIHDGDVLQSAGRLKVNTAGGLPVDNAAYDPDGSLLAQGTVNELREAYARMRYLEKMGRAGGEYYEIIQALYNTRISDARLQRAEYITGSKVSVTVNPILSTAATEAGLGDQGGHMVAAGSGGGGKFFCEEHGIVMGIYSIIPKPVYAQGIERELRAFAFEDYLIPDMASIGEQAVLSYEINSYTEAQANLTTIGYLPNYQNYKEMQSAIAGEYRNFLSQYVVTKLYSGVPTLDLEFVEVPPDICDHIFVSGSFNNDCVWVNMMHKIETRLPLPVYSDPI